MFRHRLVLVMALSATVLLVSLPGASHARGSLSQACDALQERAGAFDARVGFVVVDLTDGATCAANDGEVFRTASLYKVVVLAEAYEQSANGDFSFDETITIEPRHYQDDPPDLQRDEPVELGAREAIRRMIVFSDNAAALALRDRLDPETVGEAPLRLGLADTRVDSRFETTPHDMAVLFTALYRGEVVNPEASAEMLAVLRAQELNDLIPAALPPGTEVAHKTGLVDRYLHDAGIIFAPGGDYVFVLLTRWGEQIEESYVAIHDLTAAVYDAFGAPAPVLAVFDAAGESGTVDRILSVPLAVAPVAAEPAVASVARLAEVQVDLGDEAVGSPAIWWQQPATLLAAIAAATLIPLAVVATRRRLAVATASPGTNVRAIAEGQYATVMGGVIPAARREEPMRFGSRSNQRDELERAVDGAQAAHQSRTDGAAGSQRLQRIVEYFNVQGDLLAQTRGQVEQEMAPLTDLLLRHRQTVQRLLANLEQRLLPLNEYADSEESNLAALEERLAGEEREHVLRSFQDYIGQQRQRIDETRERIDKQRSPFLAYSDDQLDVVEVALSRFDGDLDALEENLAEQRRVMMRLLDAMRSDSFVAVKEFLSGREAALEEAMQAGVTDPASISSALGDVDATLQQSTAGDSHVSVVLESTSAADQRLNAASPAGPRGLPPKVVEPPELEEAEEEAAAGRTAS